MYKHTGYKNISDIRTLYWKTVAIYPSIIYAGYKNIYAVPDDVLITGIHCSIYNKNTIVLGLDVCP